MSRNNQLRLLLAGTILLAHLSNGEAGPILEVEDISAWHYPDGTICRVERRACLQPVNPSTRDTGGVTQWKYWEIQPSGRITATKLWGA